MNIWRPRGRVWAVGKANHMYVLHFQNRYDMDNAIRDKPWAVHGALLCLDIWRPSMALPAVQVGTAPQRSA